MSRSVSEFILDVQASRAAQRSYRARAKALRAMAAEEAATNQPLTARITRYRAFIAINAARAEFFDPEPRA